MKQREPKDRKCLLQDLESIRTLLDEEQPAQTLDIPLLEDIITSGTDRPEPAPTPPPTASAEKAPDHAQPARRRPGGEGGGAPACRCAADHAGRDRRDTAPDRGGAAQATERPLAATGGGTTGPGGERRSLIPGTPLPRGSVLV